MTDISFAEQKSSRTGATRPFCIRSNENKRAFYDVLFDSFGRHNPLVRAWRQFLIQGEKCLTGPTFSTIAIEVLGYDLTHRQAIEDSVSDPLIKEVITLKAFAEWYRTLVIKIMMRLPRWSVLMRAFSTQRRCLFLPALL